MSVDLNYGRRTGTSSFKTIVLELCETAAKFDPFIRNFVNSSGSGLTTSQQALVIALLDALEAACSAVKAMKTE